MAENIDKGPPEDAAERLESAREKFGEVVESKIRGIKDGAGKATQSVKEKAERVSAGAREKYEGAREGARHGYEKVTKDLEHLGEDVNEYVRQNPGKAIAMAVGAGFLLGILLRGRRE
ncbi:MAG: DUF883 family protein [bacterium]|nr:DUF883 family protein [bacterium]